MRPLAVWTGDGPVSMPEPVTVSGGSPRRDSVGVRADRPTQAVGFMCLVAAATMLWIGVAWVVGAGRLAQAEGLRGDRLAEVIFPIWKTRPISEHGFGGALSIEAFDRGVAYTSHPPAMLVAWFAISEAAARVSPVPLARSTNAIPFVYVVLLAGLFGWLAWSSGYTRGRWTWTRAGLLCLALGFLVSSRSLWISLLVFNSDNVFPLVGGLLMLMIPFAVDGQREHRRTAIIGLVLYALVAPTYVPVVLGTLLFLCRPVMQRAGERRALLAAAAAAMVVAIISWFGPIIIAAALGRQSESSGWVFRSGLDGDPTYLGTLLSAVVAPFFNQAAGTAGALWRRSWSELLGAAGLLLVLALAVALGRASSRRDTARWLSGAGLILFAPYLFSLLFFAQAVSIHPYLYDYLLQLPLAVLACGTMLHVVRDAADDGRATLFFGWLLAAGIMSNLISLAQGARAALAGVG